MLEASSTQHIHNLPYTHANHFHKGLRLQEIHNGDTHSSRQIIFCFSLSLYPLSSGIVLLFHHAKLHATDHLIVHGHLVGPRLVGSQV